MKAETLQPPFTGFKEWHAVCEAIGTGEQQVILRKGGIAEGRDGFAFQHEAFLLFPTFFHAQYEGIRVEAEQAELQGNEDRELVNFSTFCRVVMRAVLTDWEIIEGLGPYHVWKSEVLKERYEYGDAKCLHLAVIQAYRLDKGVTVPFEKRFGGCRSWVSLPGEAPLQGKPVPETSASIMAHSDIAKLLDSKGINRF